MADVEKKIKITVDADQAQKDLQEIKDTLKETGNQLKGISEKQAQTSSALGGIAKGFSAVGLAIKSAGIGLVLIVLNALREMLMKNEKVVRLVGIAMNYLQIAMNAIVDVVSKAYSKVMEMTNGFEHTKEVVKGLLTIAITPLKIAFQELLLYIDLIKLGWEKSPFGKKDPATIKALQEDIKQITTNLKQVAIDVVDAGKKVVKNVGGAFGEVVTAAKVMVTETKKGWDKWNNDAALALATRVQDAKKNFGLIALAAQQEIDRLEGIAEKYRQLRDDTTKSFEERIAASNALTKTLDEQLIQMNKLADAHIAEAQLAVAANKNDETVIALQTAINEKVKANADIQGKRSEQLMSYNGLLKEQQAFQLQLQSTENTRAKATMNFYEAITGDEIERLELHKKHLSDTFDLDSTAIFNKLKLYKDDATNFALTLDERKTLEHQYAIDDLLNDMAIAKAKKDHTNRLLEIENEYNALILDGNRNVWSNFQNNYKDRLKFLDEQYAIEQEKFYENEEEKKLVLSQMTQDKLNLEKEHTQATIEAGKQSLADLSSISQALADTQINAQKRRFQEGKIDQAEYDKSVAEIQKKAARREKALAVTSTIINTAQSIIKTGAELGYPLAIPFQVVAGLLGVAQIAKIISTPVDGATVGSGTGSLGSGGSGSGGSAVTSTAPNTSFSFATDTKQTNATPMRTYVLSKEVTTSQQMDRQVIANATIS